MKNQAHITNASAFGGQIGIFFCWSLLPLVSPPPLLAADRKMAKYKPFDLAIASFQGYPLWLSVVIKPTKDQKNQLDRYLVFCYGTHFEQNIDEVHICNWNYQFKEACTRTDRDVNKAFDEQCLFPLISKTLSKTYLSTKTKAKSSLVLSIPTTAAVSTLEEIINETQEELMNTKCKLINNISRIVSDTTKDRWASEFIC